MIRRLGQSEQGQGARISRIQTTQSAKSNEKKAFQIAAASFWACRVALLERARVSNRAEHLGKAGGRRCVRSRCQPQAASRPQERSRTAAGGHDEGPPQSPAGKCARCRAGLHAFFQGTQNPIVSLARRPRLTSGQGRNRVHAARAHARPRPSAAGRTTQERAEVAALTCYFSHAPTHPSQGGGRPPRQQQTHPTRSLPMHAQVALCEPRLLWVFCHRGGGKDRKGFRREGRAAADPPSNIPRGHRHSDRSGPSQAHLE